VSEVLDQSEVDALLAAVDAGQVEKDPSESSPQIFRGIGMGSGGGSGIGINGGGSGGSIAATQVDINLYDFKRPERVSKDQMRALEGLHEGFGRNFSVSLSGYLRTIVEVTVSNIEQLTYSEFIHSLPNPTCFNLLKAEQLDGQLCLEVSPLIIYPIIDRLLGGSNADLFIPQRPLTPIEQRLVQRITDRATQHLSEAWSHVTPVTFTVQDFESNPQLVQIVPPNETVVVIGFELKMGNRAGTMSLCIPYNVIEPIMGTLANQNWFSYQGKAGQGDHLRKLTGNIHNAPVEIRGFLARTTISVDELMGLQVGDIITTHKPRQSEVAIQVEGKNKFVGRIGQLRGNRAIRITRACQQPMEEKKAE
jgi:flagellar motor switch protein FliM